MNWEKIKICTVILFATLMLSNFASTSISATETPKVQGIWTKYIATDVLPALVADDLDILTPDTYSSWEAIQDAIDAGYKTVLESSNKVAFFVFNTRDYNPITGESLWPLNDTAFRVTLAWLFGHDSKEEASATIYGGPTNPPMDSIVPPAWLDYHNPDVPVYFTNPAIASETLYDAGYYVSGGLLYGPNDQPVPNDIEILSYGEPQSVNALQMSETLRDAWNDFFDNYLEVTNVNFYITPLPNFPELYPRIWITHDFQIGYTIMSNTNPASWFPSWLTNVAWGNSAGANMGYLDAMVATFKYNPDEAQRIFACHEIQRLNAENVWYLPNWYDIKVSVLHPDLEGWVSGLGFGFDNPWTWRILHWTGDSASKLEVRRWAANMPDHGWNPLEESYGFVSCGEVQVFDSLLASDPWNQFILKPWIAESWGVTAITNPQGDPGQKISLTIRDGVFWHDSGAYNDTNGNDQWDPGEPQYEYPVTAEDVKFSIDLIKWAYPAKFYPIYISDGVFDVNVTDSTVNIYVNSTEQWLVHNINLWLNILVFPKHIWGKIPPYDYAQLGMFNPATTLYKDWTGLNPPDWTKTAGFDATKGGMKCLIGTGPFVFDFWSDPEANGHLVRNPNYWCDWIREDVDISLGVNILDIAHAATAFGATSGDEKWSAPSDINMDNKIDILDLASIAIKFGWSGI